LITWKKEEDEFEKMTENQLTNMRSHGSK